MPMGVITTAIAIMTTGIKIYYAELDGTTIDGRTIKVTEARQKEQRPARRDHGGGGYNNSNSYNENRY